MSILKNSGSRGGAARWLTASLAAILCATFAPSSPAQTFSLSANQPIVVATQSQITAALTQPQQPPPLTVWPDSSIVTLPTAGSNYQFWAGGGDYTGSPAYVTAPLAANGFMNAKANAYRPIADRNGVNPVACITGFHCSYSSSNPPYVYAGTGSVYKYYDSQSNLQWILFTHVEHQFETMAAYQAAGSNCPLFAGCYYFPFYSAIGISVSTDGTTFKYLGEIVTPQVPYYDDPIHGTGCSQTTSWCGYEYNHQFTQTEIMDIGPAPFAIVGNYIYLYYWDYMLPTDPSLQAVGWIGVARANLDTVKSSTAGGMVPVFNKYYGGGWTELGINGRSANLSASALPAGADSFQGFDVKSDTGLGSGKLVMVAASTPQPPPSAYPQGGLFVATSTDGVNWTPSSTTPLETTNTGGQSTLHYPSLVGDSAINGDYGNLSNIGSAGFYVLSIKGYGSSSKSIISTEIDQSSH